MKVISPCISKLYFSIDAWHCFNADSSEYANAKTINWTRLLIIVNFKFLQNIYKVISKIYLLLGLNLKTS